MLLIQVPEVNSESSQVYKMRVLVKKLNDLKLMIRKVDHMRILTMHKK